MIDFWGLAPSPAKPKGLNTPRAPASKPHTQQHHNQLQQLQPNHPQQPKPQPKPTQQRQPPPQPAQFAPGSAPAGPISPANIDVVSGHLDSFPEAVRSLLDLPYPASGGGID